MALRVSQADPVAIGQKWIDYEGGVSFLINGLDSKDYQVARERARRLVARADEGQTLKDFVVHNTDATEFDIQCKLIGAYIIQDWRGEIYDEHDKLMPYSAENAEKLLQTNVVLLAWVIGQSRKVNIERLTAEAETVGKSSRASSGSASGAGARRSRRSSTKR